MLLKFVPLFFKYVSPVFPKTCSLLAIELFCRTKRTKRSNPENTLWESGTPLKLSSGRIAKSWGQGPTIWLLHGWDSRGSTYHKFIPIFVSAGYKVIAWDGPAHGDSPGNKTHLAYFAQAIAEDIKEYNKPIHTVVGHSFGGASIAILSKYIKLNSNFVIIGAPSEVPIIFSNFKKLINLSDRSFKYLVSKLEKKVGFLIPSSSLIANDLSLSHKVLIIHDENDKEVPIQRFTKLKGIWSGGIFYKTKGLGHRRIIKSTQVADKIIDFIS